MELSPGATTAVLIVAIAFMFAGFLLGRIELRNRRLARRLFWAAWAIGIAIFAVTMPPTRVQSVTAVMILGGLALFYAYSVTPYLKIGGKIYAMSEEKRRPDPPAASSR